MICFWKYVDADCLFKTEHCSPLPVGRWSWYRIELWDRIETAWSIVPYLVTSEQGRTGDHVSSMLSSPVVRRYAGCPVSPPKKFEIHVGMWRCRRMPAREKERRSKGNCDFELKLLARIAPARTFASPGVSQVSLYLYTFSVTVRECVCVRVWVCPFRAFPNSSNLKFFDSIVSALFDQKNWNRCSDCHFSCVCWRGLVLLGRDDTYSLHFVSSVFIFFAGKLEIVSTWVGRVGIVILSAARLLNPQPSEGSLSGCRLGLVDESFGERLTCRLNCSFDRSKPNVSWRCVRLALLWLLVVLVGVGRYVRLIFFVLTVSVRNEIKAPV